MILDSAIRKIYSPIAPSECSIIVDLDRKGNVTKMSENAGFAIPTAPAAGYIPPNTPIEGVTFMVHDSGNATGSIKMNTIDYKAHPS